MIFEKCENCKICCEIEGQQTIPLTDEERARLKRKSLIIKGKCEYLGKNGCILNDYKPFACKLFPLIFKDDEFLVFEGCPLAKKFQEEMVVREEPYNHYIDCLRTTALLTNKEKARLSKLYRGKK